MGRGDYARVAARIHPIAKRLCEAADLVAGSRVLDVATGSGNAAIAAARCGCEITGIDYVPALLERVRDRAATEGLAVEFIEAEIVPEEPETSINLQRIRPMPVPPPQIRAAG